MEYKQTLSMSRERLTENAEIILINSHGARNNETIKIYNYNIHQVNTINEIHNGVVIGIRRDIKYKLIDSFESDMLGITIETTLGPIHIVTTYIQIWTS